MNKQLTTITFLSCIREAINLSVEGMEDLGESTKSSLSNFIINEASDYEVLYFSYSGKFPKEKYNIKRESYLIDILKEDLSTNLIEYDILSEETIEELTSSLVPLSEYGLSSSRTILEYMSNVGLLIPLLKEKEYSDYQTVMGKKYNKYFGNRFDMFNDKDEMTNEKNRKLKGGSITPEEKKFLEKRYDNKNKYKTLGQALKDQDDMVDRMVQHRNLDKNDFGTPNPELKSNLSKATDVIKKLANHKVGATVIAGAILYGAYKTYKNFFSKAARSCKDLSGLEKIDCMEKFKINARKAQIADLNRAKVACKNAKNSKKCASAIDSKIQKLKSKK